jgi:uncharacterized membrane protein YeaQ/YmgE (transglycosylase-associated protein family)
MENKGKLTLEELKGKKTTLTQQNMLIGVVGAIVGVVYAKKTGGGFWRYIGYWIAGSIVVGVIPRIVYFVPKSNEIDALIKDKELKESTTTK